MRKIKRAIHLDFHTMPGITNFGEGYKAAESAQILKDANVDYVNVFARCNLGFSYYPTKVGVKYPTMKGDLLGEMIEECHKREVAVCAYINVGLAHEILNIHPDWKRVEENGETMIGDYVENNFFRTPCFNSDYRNHIIQEVKEVLEKKPDGIFLDGLTPRPCYCEKCRSLMTEKGIDISDRGNVTAFAFDTLMDIFKEVKALIPQDVRLYFNGFAYEPIADMVSHAELEYLPTDAWGYDYFPTLAPYFRKFSNDRLYMTGKFVGGWGEFGGFKHAAAIESDIYDALLYGYKPSIGDHPDPIRGLDKNLYKVIGKAYKFVESLEEFTDNSAPICEAAILKNLHDKKTGEVLDKSGIGATRILSELKITHDVVNENMDFSEYKLLILPDNIIITEKLREKLNNFKGNIISSGTSISENCVWDFIDEFAPDTNKNAYFTLDGAIYNCFEYGVKLKSQYSLSDYIEPYFQRIWDGRHGYFYVPPKENEGYCAVAKKGKVTHIAFNIFSAYANVSAFYHKELLKKLIFDYLPQRFIVADNLPSTSRASLMKSPKGTILHVKTTYPEIKNGRGIIEEHNVLPKGRAVSVLGEFKEVVCLPEKEKLTAEIKDGYTHITLPEITGYAAFLLK